MKHAQPKCPAFWDSFKRCGQMRYLIGGWVACRQSRVPYSNLVHNDESLYPRFVERHFAQCRRGNIRGYLCSRRFLELRQETSISASLDNDLWHAVRFLHLLSASLFIFPISPLPSCSRLSDNYCESRSISDLQRRAAGNPWDFRNEAPESSGNFTTTYCRHHHPS